MERTKYHIEILKFERHGWESFDYTDTEQEAFKVASFGVGVLLYHNENMTLREAEDRVRISSFTFDDYE